jgi:hypothetical protein
MSGKWVSLSRDDVRRLWNFKHAHPHTFAGLDGFLRHRRRALLRRQEKRSSRMGMSRADHRRWPNAFFAETGLFALSDEALQRPTPVRPSIAACSMASLRFAHDRSTSPIFREQGIRVVLISPDAKSP